ncbi:hypothetical protein FACS1894180_0330 [Bacteroidia bacterium]|nr:hypothetical protein FACS1894178_5670 [Bacteroidia bacterium]GHV42854.1 hypothetical protein FACS1894180_0330 [Bacteroidia bacterium]
MDISKQILYDIKNEKIKNLSKNLINVISEKYPEINKNWLLTGDGDMLITEEQALSLDIQVPAGINGIPLIPVDAIAGFPSNDIDGIRYEECEQYLVPDFNKLGINFMIRVSGSSMYPKYSNGDILACRKIEDILFYQWGKIYVIDCSQGVLVKRIFESKNNNYITLVSDNKEKYPPFDLPKSDIRSLSIVLGVIRIE